MDRREIITVGIIVFLTAVSCTFISVYMIQFYKLQKQVIINTKAISHINKVLNPVPKK